MRDVVVGLIPHLEVAVEQESSRRTTTIDNDERLLVFDIETIPGTWDNYGPQVRSSYLRPDQMIERDTMICWAGQFIGEEKIHSDRLTKKELAGRVDVRIAEKLWDIIEEADVVVGYNSDGFDIPWVQQILFGHTDHTLPKPRSIDLFKIMKKNSSRSVSNSLRTVLEQAEADVLKGEPPIGWARQVKHEGNLGVLREVLKYCKGDIAATIHLYEMVGRAGWIS